MVWREERLWVRRGRSPRSSCTAIHFAEVPNTVIPHLGDEEAKMEMEDEDDDEEEAEVEMETEDTDYADNEDDADVDEEEDLSTRSHMTAVWGWRGEPSYSTRVQPTARAVTWGGGRELEFRCH